MLAATATVIVATGQSPANIIILSLTVVSVELRRPRRLSHRWRRWCRQTSRRRRTIGGRTRAALEREKTLVLRSIKELEFDFAMGKMSQADFDEMGGPPARAAPLGLMRQLDAGGGYREQIRERSIGGASEGDDLGIAGPMPDVMPSTAEPDVCASAARTNDPDARFCKNCGAKL